VQFGYDYHIHTHHLKCADATMQVADILRRAEALGLTSIAITDHLNRPEQLVLHERIRTELEALRPAIEVYFGVELTFFNTTAEVPYSAEARDALGFEVTLGGVHSTYVATDDRATIIALQHAHHLLTCNDPLVDVLVHPWWFASGEFQQKRLRWFEDMADIPEALHRELARTARATGTAIELNAMAIFLNPRYSDRFKEDYRRYVRLLAEEGVRFALASDAHSLSDLGRTSVVEDLLADLGIAEEQLWRPAHPPAVTGRATRPA
jgi:histidinol phosphatase-like PHP family hydrolase